MAYHLRNGFGTWVPVFHLFLDMDIYPYTILKAEPMIYLMG
jgi:hypothetical protein